MSSVLILSLLVLFLYRAQAIPLTGLLEFGTGTNDSSLPTGDDETVRAVLANKFGFYGSNYINLFISTNGAISLGDELSTVVTVPFPLSNDEPLIAPFFADVDTRGNGTVWYRVSTTSQDIAFAEGQIRHAFAAYSTFTPTTVVVVTWDAVGYYRRNTDKTNTFQCILAWNNYMSFTIFHYVEDLQWTTGDINGGTNGLGGEEAQVGFNSGGGSHFSLPESQTPNVLMLDTTSNVRLPGVWVFQVDGSNITSGAIIDCGTPDINSNSTVIAPNTTFGNRAVYSCRVGFTLRGDSVRTCQIDGQWSGNAPNCTAADCGMPDTPDPTGLTVTTMSTKYNGVATYSCSIGYVLVGTANRTCQSNSMWSGEAPSCELMKCSKADLIPSNTSVLAINAPRVTYNSTAVYSCLPGYAVRNNVSRTCQANGDWTGAASTCEIVNCGPPDLPTANSTGLIVTNTSTFLDGIATYSCSIGYNFVGSNTRVCEDGTGWSGEPPQCHLVDCGSPPLHATNRGQSVSAPSTIFNQIATYSCAVGFTLQGQATRRCLENGSWSGDAPLCLVVDCGKPDFPSSGTAGGLTVIYDLTEYNATATYYCNITGYELNGENERECLVNGNWSGEPPECQLIDCGEPESANFTMETDIEVTTTSTTYNSVATYTCVEEGTRIVGESERICGADGNWTGDSPMDCEFIDCGQPDLPSAGFGGLELFYDNTTFNNSVYYNCSDEALTLVGEEERICQVDGTWSGEAPYCRRRSHSFVIGLSIGVTFAVIILLLLILLIIFVVCFRVCRKKDHSENKKHHDPEQPAIIMTNKNINNNVSDEEENGGIEESNGDVGEKDPFADFDLEEYPNVDYRLHYTGSDTESLASAHSFRRKKI